MRVARRQRGVTWFCCDAAEVRRVRRYRSRRADLHKAKARVRVCVCERRGSRVMWRDTRRSHVRTDMCVRVPACFRCT